MWGVVDNMVVGGPRGIIDTRITMDGSPSDGTTGPSRHLTAPAVSAIPVNGFRMSKENNRRHPRHEKTCSKDTDREV